MAIGSIVYSCTFSKEINNDCSFMSQKTVSMTIMLGTFSLLESQCVSTSLTVFLTQAWSSKTMFSLFVKIFFLRKHASLYTSHILLWISYGLHFSASKSSMTSSFQAYGTLFNLLPFWTVLKQIFFQD